jgi:hypothetical protein
MCVRWTPPNWSTVVGSCGNATDRDGKFGRGTDRNSVTQEGDSGPATQRCDTTQVKINAKAISRHFRDGITPNILAPGT